MSASGQPESTGAAEARRAVLGLPPLGDEDGDGNAEEATNANLVKLGKGRGERRKDWTCVPLCIRAETGDTYF